MLLQDLLPKLAQYPSLLGLKFDDISSFVRIARLLHQDITILGRSFIGPSKQLPVTVSKVLGEILQQPQTIIGQLWIVFKEIIWEDNQDCYLNQDIQLVNKHGAAFNLGMSKLLQEFIDPER